MIAIMMLYSLKRIIIVVGIIPEEVYYMQMSMRCLIMGHELFVDEV